VPPKLREFAAGGRYYKADPPLKPMSGVDFEKWRAVWEQQRRAKATEHDTALALPAPQPVPESSHV
jgi:hypothetical protein